MNAALDTRPMQLDFAGERHPMCPGCHVVQLYPVTEYHGEYDGELCKPCRVASDEEIRRCDGCERADVTRYDDDGDVAESGYLVGDLREQFGTIDVWTGEDVGLGVWCCEDCNDHGRGTDDEFYCDGCYRTIIEDSYRQVIHCYDGGYECVRCYAERLIEYGMNEYTDDKIAPIEVFRFAPGKYSAEAGCDGWHAIYWHDDTDDRPHIYNEQACRSGCYDEFDWNRQSIRRSAQAFVQRCIHEDVPVLLIDTGYNDARVLVKDHENLAGILGDASIAPPALPAEILETDEVISGWRSYSTTLDGYLRGSYSTRWDTRELTAECTCGYQSAGDHLARIGAGGYDENKCGIYMLRTRDGLARYFGSKAGEPRVIAACIGWGVCIEGDGSGGGYKCEHVRIEKLWLLIDPTDCSLSNPDLVAASDRTRAQLAERYGVEVGVTTWERFRQED